MKSAGDVSSMTALAIVHCSPIVFSALTTTIKNKKEKRRNETKYVTKRCSLLHHTFGASSGRCLGGCCIGSGRARGREKLGA